MKTNYPPFYDPKNAGIWSYDPNLRELMEAAGAYRKTMGITSSATDKRNVALLIIDAQRDFCHKEGTLFVGGRSGTGAIDDNCRLAEFIYREMGKITTILPTLDTHFAFQIFTPAFWLDEDGANLKPHDMLNKNCEIIRGGQPTGVKARPNPAMAKWLCGGDYVWLQKQCLHYVQELAKKGKYMLYIWPEHCVLGSMGHTLVGVIQEARMFHSWVRMAQSAAEVKGGNPLTENYSVLGPEVRTMFDGKGALAQKNTRFITTLLNNDAILVGGQAMSHCVRSTVDDLLEEIQVVDPALAKKVYVLADCCSSVVIPGVIDFTPDSEAALARYAAAGMNIVSSTDPMSSWLK
jgi:nicotinamidase-related amidase